MSNTMRFRQVHLDFHTSGDIPEIGKKFDKRHWQNTLKDAAVDSITCFSLCHHGWSYHPTKVGTMHPHLDFDLLRAQIDASHEIGVNVPVYLTAGFNNVASGFSPAWREIDFEGRYAGCTTNPLTPGFHKLCFNTPYLDHLCRLIEEAAALYPDGDGIFLDIIYQGQCCCPACMKGMLTEGYDPSKEADRAAYSQKVLEKYYQRTTESARSKDPAMRILHNSGHVGPAWLNRLKYFSHLELESLPTGGWGYDHFPQSAAFARKTGLEFLGMTGKFHIGWGEFGGYKHPDALRYECAAMLAFGAKCSIGNQLHPSGKLDESTYHIIGSAYSEVKQKEPWCRDAVSLAEVAIIPQEAFFIYDGRTQDNSGDSGAGRMLLEAHIPFDVIALSMDFSAYKLLILPDDIVIDDVLKIKLDAFLAGGGKLFLSGSSGLNRDRNAFLFDIGAEYSGENAFVPNYIKPDADFAPDFCNSPFVMYGKSRNIKVRAGKSLGKIYETYFNRDFRHFCSHRHTPNLPDASEYDCGVIHGNIVYMPHAIFTIYRQVGAVVYRQFVVKALKTLLGKPLIETNLPSIARLALTEQAVSKRYIVHLLSGSPVKRGGNFNFIKEGALDIDGGIEVIEDLIPLHNVECSVNTANPVRQVTVEPQGRDLPFENKNGRCIFKVDEFTCHQMVALHY